MNDGGWVERSVDYGASWNHLYPIDSYPDTNNLGQGCYAGNSGGWTESEFDLSGFIGSHFMFRFRFVDNSGDGIQDAGWYIDDVLLHATNYAFDLWPSYRMQTGQPSTTKTYNLNWFTE